MEREIPRYSDQNNSEKLLKDKNELTINATVKGNTKILSWIIKGVVKERVYLWTIPASP